MTEVIKVDVINVEPSHIDIVEIIDGEIFTMQNMTLVTPIPINENIIKDFNV